MTADSPGCTNGRWYGATHQRGLREVGRGPRVMSSLVTGLKWNHVPLLRCTTGQPRDSKQQWRVRGPPTTSDTAQGQASRPLTPKP